MKIIGLFLAVFFIITLTVKSQEEAINQADELFRESKYVSAKDKYSEVYNTIENNTTKARVAFQIAQCYNKLRNHEESAKWYKESIDLFYKNPMVYLYGANEFLVIEDYANAKTNFETYLELFPSDEIASNRLKSINFIAKAKNSKQTYKCVNIAGINSSENEFYPRVTNSSKKQFSFSKNSSSNSIASIYYAQYSSNTSAQNYSSIPLLNSEYGVETSSPNNKTIAFTKCSENSGKGKNCNIYYIENIANSWAEPKIINLNTSDTTITCNPSLSADELTLYFSSNMSGSLGGMDIWKVTRSSRADEWGTPENLGSKINTQGDENYPYIHKSGKLFFSSNGHVGFGGLDIYSAELIYGEWNLKILNMPINSTYDDYAISFIDDYLSEGLITSNRKGGKGGDDIYYFSKTVQQTKQNKVQPKAKVEPKENIVVEENIKYFEDETKIDLPAILYDYKQVYLTKQDKETLKPFIYLMKKNKNLIIGISSHADPTGDPKYNYNISKKRAEIVKQYFVQSGISQERVVSIALGENQPRVITEDFGPFKKGDVIDYGYISKLTNKKDKEIAKSLNRRSEINYLSTKWDIQKFINLEYGPNAKTNIYANIPNAPKQYLQNSQEQTTEITYNYSENNSNNNTEYNYNDAVESSNNNVVEEEKVVEEEIVDNEYIEIPKDNSEEVEKEVVADKKNDYERVEVKAKKAVNEENIVDDPFEYNSVTSIEKVENENGSVDEGKNIITNTSLLDFEALSDNLKLSSMVDDIFIEEEVLMDASSQYSFKQDYVSSNVYNVNGVYSVTKDKIVVKIELTQGKIYVIKNYEIKGSTKSLDKLSKLITEQTLKIINDIQKEKNKKKK